MLKSFIILGLSATLMASCAGTIASNPPTPVAKIADVGSRIEDSAGKLLNTALLARKAGVISEDQLDKVAIVVDRVGVLGVDLRANLDSYNAIKAAGQDLSHAKAAVLTTFSSMVASLNDVGLAIPTGTVSNIDQAVTDIFAILTSVVGVL